MLAKRAALLALLTASGCSGFPGCQPTQPISYVDIVEQPRDPRSVEVPIPRAALEDAARAAMDRLPRFEFRHPKRGETDWQLTLRVAMVTERTADPEDGGAVDPDRVRRAVGLRMELRSLGEVDGRRRTYETEVLVARNAPRLEPIDAVAKEAVLKGADDLRLAMSLENASPEDVVESLSDKDVQVRARAVLVAMEKKLRPAGPRLMEMVRDDEEAEEVVLKAIGALVAIGDPEAVSALIDAGTRRSPAYIAQLIYAVGILGGREAKAYLFTVQSGHPDPALRQVAREALEELERREEAAGGGD